ncbi:hypothetical protein G6F56_013972 [Rhizopus delemar]|nr:hypothetical protein G6F56_013972 [Rhizopus delemar]
MIRSPAAQRPSFCGSRAPMQCPRCNWQNPASNTLCFSCQAPLPVKAAAPASTPAKRAAPAQNAPVFPSIWVRLGATAIDGLFMVAAMFTLIWATSLTYEGLTGAPRPVLLLVLAGLCTLLPW